MNRPPGWQTSIDNLPKQPPCHASLIFENGMGDFENTPFHQACTGSSSKIKNLPALRPGGWNLK